MKHFFLLSAAVFALAAHADANFGTWLHSFAAQSHESNLQGSTLDYRI